MGKSKRLIVAALLCAHSGNASFANQQAPQAHKNAQTEGQLPTGQKLSATGQAELRTLISSGSFSALNEPRFGTFRGEVRRFYESLKGRLAWVRDLEVSPQARQMIEALESAAARGLNPADYDGDLWRKRVDSLGEKNANEKLAMRIDLELTICSMRFISDLRNGRINPSAFGFQMAVKERKLGLADYLREQVISSSDVTQAIAALEAQIPDYQRLEQALGRYLKLEKASAQRKRLPETGRSVKPGETYAGVQLVAEILSDLGDLPQDAAKNISGDKYEGTVVEAIKKFQRENGIESNGVLGPRTLRVLQAPPTARIKQINATLEHWRWMPQMDARTIIVNIPAYSLQALNEQAQTELSMKVVVGDAYDHKTPELASEIKNVEFRPYWNVPLSIQKKELAAKIAQRPSYLRQNDFEILGPERKPVEPKEISRAIIGRLRTGTLRLRQMPGPDNSVGLVKFEFPNNEDVYLHGTPETKLFDKKSRDLSHGCIRVEDPAELAAWVLRGGPEWTADRISAAMNGDKTERVPVPSKTSVWILYATAVAGDGGSVAFFKDVYGYDARFLGLRSTSARRNGERASKIRLPATKTEH